jgi:hypothetical protein
MIVVIHADFQLQEIILIINSMDKNIYILGFHRGDFSHCGLPGCDACSLAGEYQCL